MIMLQALLAVAVLLALVAVSAAGVYYGLWKGEQGRRIAAENMKVYGSPERIPATVADRDPSNPEQRAMEAGRLVSESTIERGAQAIVAEYKALGRDITIEEARQQATMMLNMGEFMPDIPPDLSTVPL